MAWRRSTSNICSRRRPSRSSRSRASSCIEEHRPLMRSSDLFPKLIEWVVAVCVAALALVLASPALAEKGKLRERLTPEVLAVVYPGGAERLGPEEGSPPAIALYQDDKVVAYVCLILGLDADLGY